MSRIWSMLIEVKACAECPSRLGPFNDGHSECDVSALPIVDPSKVPGWCVLICIETIAELEHEQWIAWSKAIAESEEISPERLARWKQLWVIPYADLSEEMKEHDRKWARKVLALMQGSD